jgi:hypothetical protein
LILYINEYLLSESTELKSGRKSLLKNEISYVSIETKQGIAKFLLPYMVRVELILNPHIYYGITVSQGGLQASRHSRKLEAIKHWGVNPPADRAGF